MTRTSMILRQACLSRAPSAGLRRCLLTEQLRSASCLRFTFWECDGQESILSITLACNRNQSPGFLLSGAEQWGMADLRTSCFSPVLSECTSSLKADCADDLLNVCSKSRLPFFQTTTKLQRAERTLHVSVSQSQTGFQHCSSHHQAAIWMISSLCSAGRSNSLRTACQLQRICGNTLL